MFFICLLAQSGFLLKMIEILQALINENRLRLVAIDEAHLV